MILPGETEAGFAETQSCRGYSVSGKLAVVFLLFFLYQTLQKQGNRPGSGRIDTV